MGGYSRKWRCSSKTFRPFTQNKPCSLYMGKAEYQTWSHSPMFPWAIFYLFDCSGSSLWCVGFLLPRMGFSCPTINLSSPARDWTQVLCIGRWILNHWTPREVPPQALYCCHWELQTHKITGLWQGSLQGSNQNMMLFCYITLTLGNWLMQPSRFKIGKLFLASLTDFLNFFIFY